MSLSPKPFTLLARLGGAFLLLLAVMVSLDVTVRAVTGRPLTGVFELTRLFLLVSFSLALAPVQYFDAHLRVDILSAGLRGLPARLCRGLDRVLTVAVFAMIAWVGADEGVKAFRGGFLQPGIIEIPTFIPLGFLVFGSVAVCVTIVLAAVSGRRTGATRDDSGTAGSAG